MITSAAEFVRLRTSDLPEEYERSALEEAPENVWLEIIESHPEMRAMVAYNKTIPVTIMERLSIELDLDVRLTLAAKGKAPAHVLARLATDEDGGVRARVARHGNVSTETLRTLAADPEEWVSSIATERLQA